MCWRWRRMAVNTRDSIAEDRWRSLHSNHRMSSYYGSVIGSHRTRSSRVTFDDFEWHWKAENEAPNFTSNYFSICYSTYSDKIRHGNRSREVIFRGSAMHQNQVHGRPSPQKGGTLCMPVAYDLLYWSEFSLHVNINFMLDCILCLRNVLRINCLFCVFMC